MDEPKLSAIASDVDKQRTVYIKNLYSVYKKLGQFFCTYSLTCLKKDTLVVLNVVNI